jgi:hypothetical protein
MCLYPSSHELLSAHIDASYLTQFRRQGPVAEGADDALEAGAESQAASHIDETLNVVERLLHLQLVFRILYYVQQHLMHRLPGVVQYIYRLFSLSFGQGQRRHIAESDPSSRAQSFKVDKIVAKRVAYKDEQKSVADVYKVRLNIERGQE